MDGEGQLSHFPLFADLRGRAVLVAGGGEIAARKVALLRRAGAAVTLVAPELSHGLDELAARGAATWLAQRFEPALLDGHWLVVAATDDRAVNASVATAARALRMPVNVVDDPAQSTVIVPAIIDRSPLVIAVSTGGAAPVLARRLRAEIEVLVDASWASLAALCARWRDRIRERLPDVVTRRRFYEGLVDGPVRRLLASGQAAAAEHEIGEALGSGQESRRGSVSLVGAGPGDPGLLTLNAVRALQQADVILHDQLVTAAILDLARRDAERIAVGKRAGGHQTAQAQINALMVEHARAGKRVVRLKGGDPFVFGRGGEELEHLRAHGVDYDVVPGITAALACAAYAGIPLTHREHAQSVRMVTAHCRDSLDTLDWHCLARERQTLVVYMGVGNAGAIQRELLAHGRDPLTPVAVIENGTRSTQRVLAARLDTLAATVTDGAVRSPALLIIGEVAGLAGSLAWYGESAAMTAHVAEAGDAAPARDAA